MAECSCPSTATKTIVNLKYNAASTGLSDTQAALAVQIRQDQSSSSSVAIMVNNPSFWVTFNLDLSMLKSQGNTTAPGCLSDSLGCTRLRSSPTTGVQPIGAGT